MFNLWCLTILRWVILMKFYCITLETGFLYKFIANLVCLSEILLHNLSSSSDTLCFHNTHNELVLKVAGSYEVTVFILLLLAVSCWFIIGSATGCNALSRFLSPWDKMRVNEVFNFAYIGWIKVVLGCALQVAIGLLIYSFSSMFLSVVIKA